MILVSGASGFVGGAVVEACQAAGLPVQRLMRSEAGNPGGFWHWPDAGHVDVVIHCAARVHVMQDSAENPLQAFRVANVEATLDLARLAAAQGVRRFIFLSTLKVHGEETLAAPFVADSPLAPEDAYGQSKAEAEVALVDVARMAGMDWVIIRPPLVYGPGVKANFAALWRAVERGIPLPLGAIHNRRSMVARDNLVDLLLRCIAHPGAANRAFLVSDGEDISTSELLGKMARAQNRPERLLAVPVSVLRLVGRCLGKQAQVDRLCSSLQVNMQQTLDRLDWQPVVTMDQALAQMAGQPV